MARGALCSQFPNLVLWSRGSSATFVMLSDMSNPPVIGIRFFKAMGLAVPVVLICNLDDLVDAPHNMDFVLPGGSFVPSFPGKSVPLQSLPEAPELFSHFATWKGDHCVGRRHFKDGPIASVEVTKYSKFGAARARPCTRANPVARS